jgi:glyoxylase-like metal-dependent hydrolase (beta-lactamase superfamily II)
MTLRLSPLLLGAALALGLAAGSSEAAPLATAPAAVSFTLGHLKLTALKDAENVMPNNGAVFGLGVGAAAVAQVLRDAGAPTDQIALGVDALLVRGNGRVMLFDTGLGPKVKGQLLASLALAGVSPDQVTDIFITHSHLDHVGGLATLDGRLAFPAAAIHMSAREWAFMRSQPRAAALVALIAPKVRTFEPDTVVAPGVRAVALYGHTPGHTGYEIASHGARLMDIGDAAHSSVISLAKPDWDIEYDQDRAAGRVTRRAILTRVAAGHEWVFAPHFPFPGVGHVESKGDGFVWAPGTP